MAVGTQGQPLQDSCPALHQRNCCVRQCWEKWQPVPVAWEVLSSSDPCLHCPCLFICPCDSIPDLPICLHPKPIWSLWTCLSLAVADLVYCPHIWSCHSLADSTSCLDLGPALWVWTCLRIGTLSWTLLLSLDVSCSPCRAAVSLCSSSLLLPALLSCLAPCLPCWAACFCYSLTLVIVTFFNPDLITDIICLHLELWVLNLMIRFLEALQIEHPNMCNHV